jgi:PAS domain S-box-containing protein
VSPDFAWLAAMSVLAAAVVVLSVLLLRSSLSGARARRRSQKLIQHSGDIILVIGANGRIRFEIGTADKTLGHPPGSLVGRPVHELAAPGNASLLEVLARLSHLPPGRTELRDVELARADGQRRWFEAIGQNLQDDPDIGGMLLNLRDITAGHETNEALRAAHDEAKAASLAKTRFLANMSHDLRTPLNAIIGFSDVLQNQLMGPLQPRYRAYASDIHQAGTHLLQLINDVLDVAKSEAGKMNIEPRPVPVHEACEHGMALIRLAAEQKGIALECEMPTPEPPPLWVDPRAMTQMLGNLLSNAVKFTDAGGRIVIRIRHRAEVGHWIEVIDDGIGIPEGHLARVLLPFEQVESSRDRKNGTGLGLPLVKLMVERHGGTLELSSVEGQGTTVTMFLPEDPAHGVGGGETLTG